MGEFKLKHLSLIIIRCNFSLAISKTFSGTKSTPKMFLFTREQSGLVESNIGAYPREIHWIQWLFFCSSIMKIWHLKKLSNLNAFLKSDYEILHTQKVLYVKVVEKYSARQKLIKSSHWNQWHVLFHI